MNTFLNFLETRKEFIVESFNSKDAEKALELIDKVLKKHIDGLVPLVGYVKTKQGNSQYYSKQYMVVPKKNPDKSIAFQINFSQSGEKTDIYSIDFFKDCEILFDGKAKSALTLYTLGSSVVYFLPIIWNVASSGNFNLSKEEAMKLGQQKSSVKESFSYYVGAIKYHVYENLSQNIIDETFKLEPKGTIYNGQQTINEVSNELRELKRKKMGDLRKARDEKDKNKTPENVNKWKQIIADIQDIDNALKGGATTLGELKVAVKHNVSIVAEIDKELAEAEKKLKDEHEDPDLVFKKMQKYVKMVIKGINPSVILCGAPGVGKTYNVKQLLKANGYHEGHNLCTIKGKCTPRVLYTTLMDYKEKGCIVLIDDADGLVGPNAPEDCINILKAALDSEGDDEGRLVSYGIAGPLKDDEGLPIPKKFYYNGGVIVITNYNAGSLDTALRGRSFIQDIHFSTEDILERIKKLMPAIDPEHLSAKSKIKAFDYLTELSNSDAEMEVSMRTFGICAKIFETAASDSDFTDDDARSMIKEQMRLQARREKKKKY